MSFSNRSSLFLKGLLFLLCFAIGPGCGQRKKLEELDSSSQWKRVDFPKAKIPLSSELRILAWEEYIPEELKEFFEERYEVKLNFEYIISNEELYERLNEPGERYDLIMPSSYMVQKLINEGRLRRVSRVEIPKIADIDRMFFDLAHDPGLQFSVPLFFGSAGIAANVNFSTGLLLTWSEFVEMSDGPLVQGRMGYFAEMRTGLGLALIMLGYSPNSREPEEIAQARDLLLAAKEEIGIKFLGDEIIPQLVENELIVGAVWSGDAGYILAKNGFVRYIIPKGKTLMELDSLAIPTDSRYPETAEFFINFLLTPEVMAAMTDHSYFGNTSSRSLAFVRREIRNGPSYMRPLVNDIVFLHDVEEATALYEAAWKEVIETPPPAIQKLPLPFDFPLQFGETE